MVLYALLTVDITTGLSVALSQTMRPVFLNAVAADGSGRQHVMEVFSETTSTSQHEKRI